MVFSRANLRAIPNAYTTEAELVFTASDIEHGYFSTIEAPSVSVIQFTQDSVTNSEVEFTQDGSDQIPAYTLMVTDNNGLTAGPSIARVTLNTPSAIIIIRRTRYATRLSARSSAAWWVLAFLPVSFGSSEKRNLIWNE